MISLEERLENLERRNEALEGRARRTRRAGLALVAVAGAGLLTGLAAPKEKMVEAEKVVIVDAEGKPRIVLSADKDGVGLVMMDAAGQARITTGVDKDGAGFSVKDAAGKTRAAMGEGAMRGQAEGAGVWAFDKEGKPRVGLGGGERGYGMIVLDEQGKPVAGRGQP